MLQHLFILVFVAIAPNIDK